MRHEGFITCDHCERREGQPVGSEYLGSMHRITEGGRGYDVLIGHVCGACFRLLFPIAAGKWAQDDNRPAGG